MARRQRASASLVPVALIQLKQMIDGAQSELDRGRSHTSGTLSVSAAIRAVDLICDTRLGEHSTGANHRGAIDLLATLEGLENLVEDFSLCQSHKTEFNYHASALNLQHASEVLAAARRLAAEAVKGVVANQWFPIGLNPTDFTF